LDVQADFNCISLYTLKQLGLDENDLMPSKFGRYHCLPGTGRTEGRISLEWMITDFGITKEDDFEVVDTHLFDVAIGKVVCHRDQLLVPPDKDSKYLTLVSELMTSEERDQARRLAEQKRLGALAELMQTTLEENSPSGGYSATPSDQPAGSHSGFRVTPSSNSGGG